MQESKTTDKLVFSGRTVDTPRTPNFMRVSGGNGQAIHISDFSDEEIREIGGAMTDNMIALKRKSKNV